jgi:hypothetical protein
MTVLTTTLNVLLKCNARVNVYNKLAMHFDGVEFFEQKTHYEVKNFDKNRRINLLDVIKNNNVVEAIWCLRACQQDSSDVSVAFAEFCAADAAAYRAVDRADADVAADAAAHADAHADDADAAAVHAAYAAHAAAAVHAAAAAAVVAARERQAEFLRSILSYSKE